MRYIVHTSLPGDLKEMIAYEIGSEHGMLHVRIEGVKAEYYFPFHEVLYVKQIVEDTPATSPSTSSQPMDDPIAMGGR